ncbi:MAG: amidase family protein, partial [Octadecabacter sp.]
MSDLSKLKISEARDALKKGDVTSVELTQACLSEIEKSGALNAFVHQTPDIAIAQAKAADANKSGGDLNGIPLGIKDLFCTKGVASQAASGILEGFKPEYESTVTAQLFA